MKLSVPLLRRTHVVALLCFFLPFLEFKCGFSDWTAEEKAAKEKAKQDSISAFESNTYSVTIGQVVVQDTGEREYKSHCVFGVRDTDKIVIEDKIRDRSNIPSEDNDPNKIETLPDEHSAYKKVWSAILFPGGNFSGVCIVLAGIDNLIHLKEEQQTLLVSTCFLLIIYSLINSFYKSIKSFKRIFISSIIEVICLIVFLFFITTISEVLYGYWITLGVCFFNAITSYFIWKNQPG